MVPETDLVEAVQGALNEWTRVTGIRFVPAITTSIPIHQSLFDPPGPLELASATDITFRFIDGDAHSDLTMNDAAVAYATEGCQNGTPGRVFLNTDWTFETGTDAAGNGPWTGDLQSVLVHEVGHILGFNGHLDPNVHLGVMVSPFRNTEIRRTVYQADATEAGLPWIISPQPPPPVDSDGDGFLDSADSCPFVWGGSIYNGCPTAPGGLSGILWTGVPVGSVYLGDRLERGESLRPGEFIASNNLMSVVYMQNDGNVVHAIDGVVVWHTGTYGVGADRATFQGDGNWVVYDDGAAGGPLALWDPRDLPVGASPAGQLDYQAATNTAVLIAQNNGDLVAYNSSTLTSAWWHSSTDGVAYEPSLVAGQNLLTGDQLSAGQYIRNLSSTPHAFLMQGDGNATLYGPGRFVKWSSGTSGSGAVKIQVQVDGNVVMRKASGAAVAHTGTYGHGGQGVFARLGNDGNFVVYVPVSGSVQALWHRFANSMNLIPW